MAKWVLPEGRKPLPDEWFAERAQMQERIKELEAQIKEDALQYLSDTGQMCDRIEELEAKLAKANDHIEGLEELLWAAEKDASEAEAYAGELEAKLEKAEWLLVDATVQLEEGKIKTRRNRAALIRQFLAELTGGKDE